MRIYVTETAVNLKHITDNGHCHRVSADGTTSAAGCSLHSRPAPQTLAEPDACPAGRVELPTVCVEALAQDLGNLLVDLLWAQSLFLGTVGIKKPGWHVHWQSLMPPSQPWHAIEKLVKIDFPLTWPQNDL